MVQIMLLLLLSGAVTLTETRAPRPPAPTGPTATPRRTSSPPPGPPQLELFAHRRVRTGTQEEPYVAVGYVDDTEILRFDPP
ncbi:H-2 class I histocompatibility antigen, K-B alpha chain-like [Sturnira hondurensis]|uniref:H-2 class I histocompatibility antigen, K-B alpha chain-like n=1 Tax=Sturnira hondurensis TaxID=192404 RepID=UPI0018791721|nr:H-2 class I histocompatibility antigen, K-B alpha chain-like [Sturnira hondurensis]